MKKAIRLAVVVLLFFLAYKCVQHSDFFSSSSVKSIRIEHLPGAYAAPEFRRLNDEVYFFSSFVDLRAGNIGFPRVRVVTLIAKSAARNEFFCSFGSSAKTKAQLYELAENHAQRYGTFFISCELPDANNLPASFFVGYEDESVELEVTYVIEGETRKPPFVQYSVCVPFLFGTRYSPRDIVEFVELNRLVGAQKIFVYIDKATLDPEIARTIEFYESRNLLHAISFTIPIPDKAIWYHAQLASIADCHYRNVGFSKYVAFHDIDEVLIPRNSDRTVGDVLDGFTNGTIASYRVSAVYFDTAVSPPIRLNSKKYSGRVDSFLTKCVLRPEMVFEQGIHHTSRVIQDHFQAVRIPHSLIRLHHYKPSRPLTADTVVSDKYGSAFVNNFGKVVDLLKI